MYVNNPQLYKAIADFVANTLTGIFIHLYKTTNVPLHVSDIDNKQRRVLLFTKYLNEFWAALVAGQDQYSRDTMAGIIEHIPDESPRCIMHLFSKIGLHCIDTVNVGNFEGRCPIPADMRVATNPEYTAFLASACTTALVGECDDMAKRLFRQRGPHHCTNLLLAHIATENPAPLWSFKHVAPVAIIRDRD